mgnify:CR=1 FL=1|tara:strand:- start:12 stop:548 length:537 start_codon:yes stop_codon:yes gene_type:complete
MTWFNVLKMPNPHGGQWFDLTRGEYYKLDDNNKRLYHKAMNSVYDERIKAAVKPRKAGQPPPYTDDQIREYRELYRFHGRQRMRFTIGSEKDNYYSLEEEKNRQAQTPIYDAVERIPITTKEIYDGFTRQQKQSYWSRAMGRDGYIAGDKFAQFSTRMYRRMMRDPNFTPPFKDEESM